jgi:hypothetical protein
MAALFFCPSLFRNDRQNKLSNVGPATIAGTLGGMSHAGGPPGRPPHEARPSSAPPSIDAIGENKQRQASNSF